MKNCKSAVFQRVSLPVFVMAVIAAFFLIFPIGCASGDADTAASSISNSGFLSSSAEDVIFKFILDGGLFQNTAGFGTSRW